MVNLHLHIVGAKPDGVQCLPSHIPGARVHIEGYLDSFCLRRFVADYVSDRNGVVNFPIPNACYDLSIGATTPKGRQSEMRQTGAFTIETDVTWVLGIPGACDEASAAADAGAAAGGFGEVAGWLLLLGVLAVGGYVVYRVVRGRRREP